MAYQKPFQSWQSQTLIVFKLNALTYSRLSSSVRSSKISYPKKSLKIPESNHSDINVTRAIEFALQTANRSTAVSETSFVSDIWIPPLIRFTPSPTEMWVCPICIDNGYHSPIQQLPWVTHCPFHKVELINKCPQCSRGLVLDKGSLPYLCRWCGYPDIRVRDSSFTNRIINDGTTIINRYLEFIVEAKESVFGFVRPSKHPYQGEQASVKSLVPFCDHMNLKSVSSYLSILLHELNFMDLIPTLFPSLINQPKSYKRYFVPKPAPKDVYLHCLDNCRLSNYRYLSPVLNKHMESDIVLFEAYKQFERNVHIMQSLANQEEYAIRNIQDTMDLVKYQLTQTTRLYNCSNLLFSLITNNHKPYPVLSVCINRGNSISLPSTIVGALFYQDLMSYFFSTFSVIQYCTVKDSLLTHAAELDRYRDIYARVKNRIEGLFNSRIVIRTSSMNKAKFIMWNIRPNTFRAQSYF